MPKTQNAFAFRDFNAEKILQRPFFKGFHFNGSETDAQILQSLTATDDDTIDDMERKLRTIEKVQEKLVDFYHFIGRHTKRCSRCFRREENNDKVVLGYFYASLDCVELTKRISTLYDGVEKQIQQRYRSEFAKRLKQARRTAGLTQRQLADMVQISPTGFASYEQAKSDPSIPTLIRLAKILKLSESQLLGLT